MTEAIVDYLHTAGGHPTDAGYEAFKRSRTGSEPVRVTHGLAPVDRYTTPDGADFTIENAGDTEHARAVRAGAIQERAQKEAWQARERANAERRRTGARAVAGEAEAAAANAARQRDIERDRADRTLREVKPARHHKADA